MSSAQRHLRGSFRDPSGFVFKRDGIVYRQVQESYADRYRRLIDSGLYDALVEQGLLLAHEEASVEGVSEGCYRVLRPRQLGFISYPYEWSMSQLRDAALATISIQEIALSYGMLLKDASAYNIQFVDGRPVLIDTLSFDLYRPGEPWVAYRQFCRHFLAPLALMSYVDLRTGMLLRLYIDGIPLDLASRMLPTRARLVPAILLHIIIHSGFQKRHGQVSGSDRAPVRAGSFPMNAMRGLVAGLRRAVERLASPTRKHEWTGYYEATNYSENAFSAKQRIVGEFIDEISPRTLWDLGANDGRFSELAARRGIATVAMDSDPTVVERCYAKARDEGNRFLHPILVDLTNPSPALGWAHEERLSLVERGPADAVMALALIHHLAIGNNVPLSYIAMYFAECGRFLIVEFVPKSDSQVRGMLAAREDVFPGYTRDGFEEGFGEPFTIRRREDIPESDRTMYLMERRW